MQPASVEQQVNSYTDQLMAQWAWQVQGWDNLFYALQAFDYENYKNSHPSSGGDEIASVAELNKAGEELHKQYEIFAQYLYDYWGEYPTRNNRNFYYVNRAKGQGEFLIEKLDLLSEAYSSFLSKANQPAQEMSELMNLRESLVVLNQGLEEVENAIKQAQPVSLEELQKLWGYRKEKWQKVREYKPAPEGGERYSGEHKVKIVAALDGVENYLNHHQGPKIYASSFMPFLDHLITYLDEFTLDNQLASEWVIPGDENPSTESKTSRRYTEELDLSDEEKKWPVEKIRKLMVEAHQSAAGFRDELKRLATK